MRMLLHLPRRAAPLRALASRKGAYDAQPLLPQSRSGLCAAYPWRKAGACFLISLPQFPYQLARDKGVAFFLHFSLSGKSLIPMEDLSSPQPCWGALYLAGGVARTEARASACVHIVQRRAKCHVGTNQPILKNRNAKLSTSKRDTRSAVSQKRRRSGAPGLP